MNVFDRMDWRMCLIIRIADFRVDKLVLIDEFLYITLIFTIWPESVDKVFKVECFGEGIGLSSGVTDITFGVKVFSDFHDFSRGYAEFVSG